jgi:ABC-type nitrate/sulfonate/bicarbonate transport system permease component
VTAGSTVTGWLIRLGPLVLVAALAALWEAASRFGFADPRLLPPLSDVLRVLAGLLQDARFRGDLGITLSEIAVAFAIVGPLGLAVGFFLGESLAAYRMFAPALHLLLSIPKSIFLPVFIFAFGIGFLQKVIFAVTLAFFIVVLSGIAAARSVPAGLVTAARSFGATRAQIYLRIYLPAMEPLMVVGLRMGLIFTVTGVLLAEMYATPRGIGRVIFAWGEMFKMPELFEGVLLVVVMTVICNELLRGIEEFRKSRRRGFR